MIPSMATRGHRVDFGSIHILVAFRLCFALSWCIDKEFLLLSSLLFVLQYCLCYAGNGNGSRSPVPSCTTYSRPPFLTLEVGAPDRPEAHAILDY